MRSAPAPRLARTAALQPSTEAPSSQVLTKGAAGGRGTSSRKFDAAYADWQTDAKAAARTIGVARFNANMYAITAARVDLIVEELADDNRSWVPSENPMVDGLMAEYDNQLLGQTSDELARFHMWHYVVGGEGLLVSRDGQAGVAEHFVFSTRAAEWDRPIKGQVTLRLTPGGSIRTGEAFAVPRAQAVRFWMPDEEYAALPVSPMTAAMDDLRRWQDLTRYAHRVARNYLAMNGLLWTPNVAHEDENDPADVAVDDTLSDAVAEIAKTDPLVDLYQKIAQTSIAQDDRLESVVPPMVWWGEAGDEPKWVQVGRGLDEYGIAHRQEALMDYGRGVDTPGSIIASGGGATENHWNEWLNEARFLGSVAPMMDRITHQDLTVTFVRPTVRLRGGNPARFRCGYDASNVISHPDKTDAALRAWLAGIIGVEPAARYMGFQPDDLADEEDLMRLARVRGFSRSNSWSGISTDGTGMPSGPSTVEPGPPDSPDDLPMPNLAALDAFTEVGWLDVVEWPAPLALPAAPAGTGADALPEGAEASPEVTSPDGVAGLARTAGIGTALRRVRPRTEQGRATLRQVRAYRQVTDRLSELRRDVGRQLLAGAEVAFAEALRLAGIRAVQKARSKSAPTARAMQLAWEQNEPIGSMLAALSMTEEQLLAGAFASYQAQAEEWLGEWEARQRTVLLDAGLSAPEEQDNSTAALFLALALGALARQRIMRGTDPSTAESPGEVSGNVPGRFAQDAVRIAEGSSVMQAGETLDAVPQVWLREGARPQAWVIEEMARRIAGLLEDESRVTEDEEARARLRTAAERVARTPTEFVWVHGFYGYPRRPFPPHVALNGYTTVAPDSDPDLYHGGEHTWLSSNGYEPGDHVGCTCEWMVRLSEQVDVAVAEGVE